MDITRTERALPDGDTEVTFALYGGELLVLRFSPRHYISLLRAWHTADPDFLRNLEQVSVMARQEIASRALARRQT